MTADLFCNFLHTYNDSLYKLAFKVDELVYVDAASAILQGRRFIEILLKDVYEKEDMLKEETKYPSLYEMIRDMRVAGVYEKKLQERLDFIRLHGNKVAHEEKEHSQIIALKVHRNVHEIAGWYVEVYGSPEFETPEYVEPRPKAGVDEDYIQSIIQQHIQKLTPKTSEEEHYTKKLEDEEIITEDLSSEESYLIRELNRLKVSSQEALENVGDFSKFKNYMHVERSIQSNLEAELGKASSDKKKLILLAGSVGDGKSHLLSYLAENKPELIRDFTVINDATESDAPDKDSLETLREKLRGFSDQEIDSGEDKIILAINLGVLNNFVSTDHKELSFQRFIEFVNESNLFTNEVSDVNRDNEFSVINFSDYQPFELTENRIFSSYFNSILEKVTDPSLNNPFYQAYKLDIDKSLYTAVHLNFELLSLQSTRYAINELLCNLIIKDKIVVSTREFLNFISDLLIPSNVKVSDLKIEYMTEFDRIQYSLPTLLFEREGRSEILDGMSQFDPINKRTKSLDEIINSIYSTQDFEKVISSYANEESFRKIFDPFINLLDSKENSLEAESFESLTKLIVRSSFFTNSAFREELKDPAFTQYIRFLYGYNRQMKPILKEIYNTIRDVVFSWNGSPKEDYIYINNMSEQYRVAQKVEYKPYPDTKKQKITKQELQSFDTTLTIVLTNSERSSIARLEIDYPLFQLLYKVSKGYRPSKKDIEDGLSFVTFLDQFIALSSKESDLLIHYHGEKELFRLKREFIGFAFEKVEN